LQRTLYPPAKDKQERKYADVISINDSPVWLGATPTFAFWMQGKQRATLKALANRGLVVFFSSTGAVRLSAAFFTNS